MYVERRGRFVDVCPGDGTRYEFAVVEVNDEMLFVAGNLCTGYQLRKDSVRQAGAELMTGWGKSDGDLKLLDHPYIRYLAASMSGRGGTKPGEVNLWTVRAAILAAYITLGDWESENGR